MDGEWITDISLTLENCMQRMKTVTGQNIHWKPEAFYRVFYRVKINVSNSLQVVQVVLAGGNGGSFSNSNAKLL